MAQNDTPQNNLLKLASAMGFELAEGILATFIQKGVESEYQKYKEMSTLEDWSIDPE